MTKSASVALHSTETWTGWAQRFRQHCSRHGLKLKDVADRLGKAESTVRSWTNGTREVNLTEFFALCAAAQADPATVLFGHVVLTERQRELVDALSASFNNERKSSSNP